MRMSFPALVRPSLRTVRSPLHFLLPPVRFAMGRGPTKESLR